MADAKKMTIDTTSELARLVGISRQGVSKWLKHPAWPFAPEAPWPIADLPRIQAWARTTLQENRAAGAEPSPEAGKGEGKPSDGSLTEARRQKVLREAALIQMKLQAMRDNLHAVDECRAQQEGRVAATKQALTASLPGQIVQCVRRRERDDPRPLGDLEFAELIRVEIERTIAEKLAPPPPSAAK